MHLYGRAHEERALCDGLRRAHGRRGSLLLLHGQRGSGKTALANRLAAVAADSGACVIAGPAVRHRKLLLAASLAAGTPSFQTNAFQTYLGRAVRQADGRELGLLDEVLAAALPASCDAARPLLIALDDVAWDDPDVRGALPVLAAGARRPVAWLLSGSGRPGPPEPRWDGDTVDVRLGPLPRHEVLGLAADRLGGLPDGATRGLLDACGGHPGLLGAVLDALAAEGGHQVRDGVAARTAAAFAPRTVALLLRADPRLSAGTRALLAGIAAGNRPCRTADLSRMPERRAVAALAAVRDAAEAGVLVVDGDVLRFRHYLLREAALLLPRADEAGGAPGRGPCDAERAGAERAGAASPGAERPSSERAGAGNAAAGKEGAERPGSAADAPPISATEGTIVRLVAAGLTNGQIASRVNLSPHTVNFHLRKIFRKLGVSSRTELVGTHLHLFGPGEAPESGTTPHESRTAHAG